jgi:L-threonylcarbamoyladenylate synthase
MIPLHREPADPDDRDLVGRLAIHLDRGGLVAYPTETVYGLGARADGGGVSALRTLKGREDGRPFLVLLPAKGEGEWPDGLVWTPPALALAGSFWPGPLTLVLADPECAWPEGVRSARGGVAVRRSPHPFVQALLRAWPHPLLSTSANRPGEPPARSADAVERAVQGRPGLHRLWILDGGPLVDSGPSTLVDCTGPVPRVLRHGPVSFETLRDVVPELEAA